MPEEFRQEIRGMADALADSGRTVDFGKLVMHATQAFSPPGNQFPWFNCPWPATGGPPPGGSFSYAVWGGYVAGGGSLTINSPDWGAVPPSLARNRVIFSIRPATGYRHVFLGVAGTIGLTGMNETGVSVGGTAGQRCSEIRMPLPGNGVPVPDGFLTLFLMARHILTHYAADDPRLFDRIETEILAVNPMDGFITQVSAPGRSAVWEPGATASPGYPFNSRRAPGEWDDGRIMPVDIRGDFILTQRGVFRISDVADIVVEYTDGLGNPYSGRATLDGSPVEWRVWKLGWAVVRPDDPGRGERLDRWFAALGTDVPRPGLPVFSPGFDPPPTSVSSRRDRTGGYWTDGADWGWWTREGSTARSFYADGTEMCSGPVYDFGAGLTGWCDLGGDDLEWVAWTYDFAPGANERLDGMNLTVLPAAKPWAFVGAESGFWEQGPHPRTHFVLNRLGAPAGALTLESLFDVFQDSYLSLAGEDAPFGVGTYDLVAGEALVTVSRYEGSRFVGGLNPEQVPIRLDRCVLFGE
jgi:hypothetical protein